MFEKRKHTRITYREAIEYHVLPGPAVSGLRLSLSGGSLSWDLSEGGVRFRVTEFLPLNTELSLRFILNHERPVTLVARVVWIQRVPHSDQFHFGLEFKKTPENIHGQRILRDFIVKSLDLKGDG